MQLCIHCGKDVHCDCGGGKPFGGAMLACPLKKGAIWVHVLDDDRTNLKDYPVTCGGKPGLTNADGVAPFDPLSSGPYTVTLEPLPKELVETHKLPDVMAREVTVADGEIGYVPFRLPLLEPEVSIVSITPVFAPEKDDVDIVCKFKNGGRIRSLLVEITDSQGVAVHRGIYRKSTGTLPKVGGPEATATLQWRKDSNGKSTADSDPDPILVRRSPYTAKVSISVEDLDSADRFANPKVVVSPPASENRVGRDQTIVRCHSLQLELIPWPEAYFDATARDAATIPVAEDRAAKVIWIKYKLNEMGFFAGPLTAAETDPNFEKALIRYRVMRMMPLDARIVPLGAPVRVPNDNPQAVEMYDGPNYYDNMYSFNGSNFVANASPASAKSFESDAAVDQCLVYLSLENPADPMDRSADFADPGKSIKLFLRNNRYYVTNDTEWGGVRWDFTETENHCYKIAREWLSEPHLPVRAVVTIEDRQGQPQEVPFALDGVGVAWAWQDEIEDLSNLPSYGTPSRIDGSKTCASRTKEYLLAVRPKIGLRIPSVNANLFHNAIREVGGKLTDSNDENAWGAFAEYREAIGKKIPVAGSEPGYVVTAVKKVKNRANAEKAVARVYLTTSTIAGDNYRLKVKLDFSGCGGQEDVIKTLHGKLSGDMEVNNPELPGGDSKLTEDRLSALQSSKITVWRKMTLAAFIQWPERQIDSSWNGGLWQETEWNLLRDEYRDAFVDIPGFGERKAVAIADRGVFPHIESDYSAAMSEISDRNGWEKTNLELELATVNLKAINDQLMAHLGPEKPEATGAFEVLELCTKWINSTESDAVKRAALAAAGNYFKTAVEAVSEADPDSGAGQLIFKPALTAQTLNSRAAQDFNPDGTVKVFQEDLSATLAEMDALRVEVNTLLKQLFGNAPPPNPATASIEAMELKADAWRVKTDPDPIKQAILQGAGNYYKAALAAISEPNPKGAGLVFKPLAGQKGPLGRRQQKDFHSLFGTMNAYPSPFTEAYKQLMSQLNTLNTTLKNHLNPAVDATELNSLANKAATWAARDVMQWQAQYPDWTNEDLAEIKRAAQHYQAAIDTMAEQLNPGGPWTFRQGLQRGTLYAKAANFTKVPEMLKYNVSAPVLQAMLRLRADGLFPFRLKGRKYTLAEARERMAEAAAQIGFALSRLMHKTVRRRLRLKVENQRFKDLSDGAVLVDNITHPQIELADGTPWKPFGLSMGSPMGIFFTSHFTPFRLYALGTHEWAHILIIQHWFNAGGAPIQEHDQSDMNCMMGYPYIVGDGTNLPNPGTPERIALEEFVKGNGAVEKYTKFLAGDEGSFGVFKGRMLPKNHLPHFCGKCNLQIRGWNIYAGGATPVLPRCSATPNSTVNVFPDANVYDPLTFDSANL